MPARCGKRIKAGRCFATLGTHFHAVAAAKFELQQSIAYLSAFYHESFRLVLAIFLSH